MANQLVKLSDVQYTPGRPYQPGNPAYCYWSTVTTGGYWGVQATNQLVKDPDTGQYVWFTAYTQVWVPEQQRQVQVCVPASPEVPAIPPTTSTTAIIGWNAGARSVDPLVGDGYFAFKVSSRPVAISVGIARANLTNKPDEPSHSFYISGTNVDIVEFGSVVVPAFASVGAADELRIERSGSTITYRVGANSYTSSLLEENDVFLDVAIYASGDFVTDPVLGALTDGAATASGALQPLAGLAGNYDPIIDGIYIDAGGRLAPLTGTAAGLVAGGGESAGTLRALTGVSANYAYAFVDGQVQALVGEADGGYPTPAFVYAFGVVPPLSGSSVASVGVFGQVVGTFSAAAGLAADYDDNYMQAAGSMRLLTGTAVLTTPDQDLPVLAQSLALVDGVFGIAGVRGTIEFALELGDSAEGTMVVTDSYIDALVLQDSYSLSQVLQETIRAALLLAGDTTLLQQARVQYAVNVLTGALSTYEGFDFTSFASAGGNVYGVKDGAVYLVRRGDDDGLPISVSIDLGATDLGVPNAKHVDAAYLGVSTDGQVFLRASADGAEQVYRVVQRGPIMRALLARGVTGRRWNFSLEAVDATEFELDLVEFKVSVSSRRWTR